MIAASNKKMNAINNVQQKTVICSYSTWLGVMIHLEDIYPYIIIHVHNFNWNMMHLISV